jgi:hypothetical protein
MDRTLLYQRTYGNLMLPFSNSNLENFGLGRKLLYKKTYGKLTRNYLSPRAEAMNRRTHRQVFASEESKITVQ